jgi:hypothetical protein
MSGAMPPLRSELRVGARWLLVGAAAGAVVGLIVGGVGGRLLMLVLRLASPGSVGLVSDDGFEIGVVSHRTLQLFGATTQIGAVGGIGYVAARAFIADRMRVLVWAVVGGALGSAAVVHSDGRDFTLEPRWLAVGGFVAIAVVAGAGTAALVERAARERGAWATSTGVLAAVLGGLAVLLALPFALATLGLARIAAIRSRARSYGRLVAAVVLSALVAVSLAKLVRDVSAIF